MKKTEIELFEDFTSSFPRGILYEPQLQVIGGKYKGLVVDLWYSIIVCTQNKNKSDNTLEYKYSIEQMWDSVSEDQFDGLKIVLTNEDQEFLHLLVLNYIIRLNKTNKIRKKK